MDKIDSKVRVMREYPLAAGSLIGRPASLIKPPRRRVFGARAFVFFEDPINYLSLYL
jgi:hypothetical protein